MNDRFISRFLLLCALCGSASAEVADHVLINGQIYTANARAPWASAVAVRDGRFVYVGDEEGASALVGENTRKVDLGGRLVLPGLIDAHTHPGMVAISHDLLEMELVDDRETMMRNIAGLVAASEQRDVLMGGYWYNHLFGKQGPHKRDLDRIESERPLILYDYWGHSVWANSKALEMAGVDRDTPDIVPGFAFYQRDENGEPSGWISESAASVFVNKFLTMTPAVEEQLLGFLQYLSSMGVTTLLDAGNFGRDEEVYAAISRFDKAGRLPLRYHGTYTLFLPQDYATAVDSVKQLNDKYGSDRLRIDTLKVFNDGVIETRTADMFDDYLDTPGNSGNSLLSEQQFHDLIIGLSKEGINLHVHSVGNRSTHTVLNAVERVQETLGARAPIRIALCHLETVLDSDFNRFKDLGVIASFTPHWHGFVGDENVQAAIGEQAWSQMRGQPMIADDAPVTFSSDITTASEWKAGSANPFLGMQIGHNRQGVEGGAVASYARPRSERLRLDTLVDGYTIHAAYQFGREHELGSIAAGKRADLVVLEQNLFEAGRYEVHKTRPALVMMDGEVVHGEF
jgi:predicted amidohydrolase YtcJ